MFAKSDLTAPIMTFILPAASRAPLLCLTFIKFETVHGSPVGNFENEFLMYSSVFLPIEKRTISSDSTLQEQ